MDRRNLLKGTLLGLGLIATKITNTHAWLRTCGITPKQAEGPFYPMTDQLDKDADLIFSTGHSILTQGEIIYVKGTVRDQYCNPLAGVLVEIWQACATGKYNHPEDNNPAPLDPHFQYWGQARTNARGEYLFRTIKPGAYPAGSDRKRTPHIHFKVQAEGQAELVTQMYFAEEALNASDFLVQNLTPAEKKRVIIPFLNDQGKTVGQFDIVLNVQ